MSRFKIRLEETQHLLTTHSCGFNFFFHFWSLSYSVLSLKNKVLEKQLNIDFIIHPLSSRQGLMNSESHVKQVLQGEFALDHLSNLITRFHSLV